VLGRGPRATAAADLSQHQAIMLYFGRPNYQHCDDDLGPAFGKQLIALSCQSVEQQSDPLMRTSVQRF
jgi:hypothetical protein